MFDKASKSDIYTYVILGLLVGLNTLVFTMAAFTLHTSFNTFGFDLGIQHQATWLISRFHEPFSTVNGLHFFGGHARFIAYLTAPFLWIWQDARMMLVLQAFMLSMGAIPLFLLAKARLNSNVLGLGIVIAYLLYPALCFLNLENFHYDTFAPVFILFAFYFLVNRRFVPYFIFAILAMISKEEVAATILLIGVYAFFINRKVGIATVVGVLLYLVFLLNVLFPAHNPDGYAMYSRLRVAEVVLADPFSLSSYREMLAIAQKNLFTAVNANYLFQLLYPVAFLALLSPKTLVLAASLYINTLSDWSYAHRIDFHHVAPIVPMIFISVVFGISYLKESKILSAVLGHGKIGHLKLQRFIAPFLVCLLLAAAIVGNARIGPERLRLAKFAVLDTHYEKAFHRASFYERVFDSIPREATVTASYNVVPHLSDRKVIFQYPNPFLPKLWGMSKDVEYTDIEYVDFVILDPRRDREYEEFTRLLDDGTYVMEKEVGPFVFYRHAEAAPLDSF